jgi:hypothetical protein
MIRPTISMTYSITTFNKPESAPPHVGRAAPKTCLFHTRIACSAPARETELHGAYEDARVLTRRHTGWLAGSACQFERRPTGDCPLEATDPFGSSTVVTSIPHRPLIYALDGHKVLSMGLSHKDVGLCSREMFRERPTSI